MLDDPDPITAMGMDYGCMYCGSKTDSLYFLEYYALPRKRARKRHREKERQILVCQSCYEANGLLVISIDDKPFAISKSGCRDMNNLKCIVCRAEIKDAEIYSVISSLHMIGGSGIESKPLAFFCSSCAEEHTIEF